MDPFINLQLTNGRTNYVVAMLLHDVFHTSLMAFSQHPDIPEIIPYNDVLFRNVRISLPYARRMTCRVRPHEAEMEIVDFLRHRFSFRSRTGWEERLCQGRITQGETVLRPGDRLFAEPPLGFFTPAQTEPSVPDEVAILEDTDDYLLVYKPAPMPVHPGGRYNKNTLTSILNELFVHSATPAAFPASSGAPASSVASDSSFASSTSAPSGAPEESDESVASVDPGRLHVLHRLDSVTSGLVLFGRNSRFSNRIQQAFAQNRTLKSYLAVASGSPVEERITIEKPIRRKSGYLFECALNGKAASTEFRVLLRGENSSLVKCMPRTGRTHQIRLHLREWGYPIIDDPVYGIVHDSEPLPDSERLSDCPFPMQNRGISLLHYHLCFPNLKLECNLFDYFPRPDIAALLADEESHH